MASLTQAQGADAGATSPHSFSVMKFGGSSFATAAQIAPVCAWIARRLARRGPGHRVICVVSAPSGLTEQYRATLLSINPTPAERLIDAALPLADSLGAVLVAGALQAQGVRATVALGNQIGLRTDRNYTRAQLQSGERAPLQAAFAAHQVVLVPGGQASAADTGETTWMGKNSSDLSAIALAAAFGCDEVEIYSDVPGVYSCDPNMVGGAYPIARLSHRQAVQMSVAGAKVLHHRGVQFALAQGIRIVCRGNAGEFATGTILTGDEAPVAAVVPDARAQVFGGAQADIARAMAALEAAGVPVVATQAPDGAPRLIVTCGFFDAPHFLAQRQLELHAIAQRLVSVITPDGTVLRELVDPAQLGARAAALHQLYCSAPPALAGVAAAPVPTPGELAKSPPGGLAAPAAALTAPLAERLAVLAATAGARHV